VSLKGITRPLQSEHEAWLGEGLFKSPVFVTDCPSTLKPFYTQNGRVRRPIGTVRGGVGRESLGGTVRAALASYDSPWAESRSRRLWLARESQEARKRTAGEFRDGVGRAGSSRAPKNSTNPSRLYPHLRLLWGPAHL
jgi:hypothetical protein